MKFLRNIYVKIRNKIVLWNNMIGGFIRVEIINKRPRLVVHEKYENAIKWVLRILTLIGILTSAITFQWHIGLTLAIFLCFIEQILEKIVFMFTTFFIQPIPRSWNPEEWLGMIFGIPLQGNVYKLGMLFQNENYAKEIFQCIKSWNYNQDKDLENNVNISFIIENDSEYSTYIYPSLERKSIKISREEAEKDILEKRQIKEHQQLIMTIIMCKSFDNLPSSNFRLFQSCYRDGDTIEFGSYFMQFGQPRMIHGINPVLKSHLKIKNRNELTRKDIEYEHGKFVMNK